MKINLPVSDQERHFDPASQLLSTTNEKGVITHVNQEFIDISGFSTDELLRKNHNVVRHPDMPPEAFADLWQDLKAGKHWMGIVKNRCKNGDYYWVDAFVSPIQDGNRIVGYESVRARPLPQHRARAERLYKQLREKRKSFRPQFSFRTKLFIGFLGILGGSLGLAKFLQGGALGTWLLIFLLGAFFSGLFAHLLSRRLREAAEASRYILDNSIARLVYGGANDEIGQLSAVTYLVRAKLRTVVGRIDDAAMHLSNVAEQSSINISQTSRGIRKQQEETDQAATAMHEMAATVQEVARNAADAAHSALAAHKAADTGKDVILGAINTIGSLAKEVEGAAAVIRRVERESENIGTLVSAIREITDQTNLLALNAAIEAARAGEAGRGFAVVADEVRNLADRTKRSAVEIEETISRLQLGAHDAMNVMERGQSQARDSMSRATEAGNSLDAILKAIQEINDMNTQIANAVEEQSAVAVEISRNISSINYVAGENTARGVNMAEAGEQLLQMAINLNTLVKRFSLCEKQA